MQSYNLGRKLGIKQNILDVNFEFKPDFNENCRNRKTEVPDIGKRSVGSF